MVKVNENPEHSEEFHLHFPRKGVIWALLGGAIFAGFGLILGFYFGGYPGFLFFKQFYWFPLPLSLRTYLGLALGTLLGIAIFWAFGTIAGALAWWIINGRKKNA